jgi:uncharacterized Zn-binding protein involved in type VI secretion
MIFSKQWQYNKARLQPFWIDQTENRIIMGKPAARVLDMHVCPMITVLVPHVGGPILPILSAPNVLIGGLPAATVGTMCFCAGGPDTIVMGSSGVFIGGKPAARMGDMTAHGGSIVLGCFTVLIGETGGGGGSSASNKKDIMEAVYSKVGADQAKDIANANALKEAASNGSETAERTDKKDFTAEFTLKDAAGKAVKGVKYQIETPDGELYSGKTDDSGKTEQISGFTIAECNPTFFNRNKL